MSELLNDSPTAVKIRDKILSQLHPGEQVLYVTEGQVQEPYGSGTGDFNLYIGAIIVTSERLLVFESKAFGRASHVEAVWRDVERTGRHDTGEVGVQKYVHASRGRPLWKISIWEGKSYKTPLDAGRLDMLSMAIQEARLALAAEMADESAAHDAQVGNDYEELRRRRGF